MNHHLSTSLSASAASALHVLGAHVRSFAPSPRIVLGVAALASAGVFGIAGVGDEHIDILSNIAVTCSDEDEVDEILKSSVDDIYNTFANIEGE